ncbi:MAG: Hpt domain-containing protein, partial [Chromatiaceae bacterium]
IKPFAEETQSSPDEEARALLQDLLAHISVSDTSSYQATDVRASNRRPPEEVLAKAHTPPPAPALGPDALAALSAEVHKELMPVKELLELFARGPRDSTEPLLQLEPRVARLATTLAVTGASDLVERLRGSAEKLGAMGRGTAPAEEEQLKAVAADLRGVEITMTELGWGAREDGQAPAEMDAVLTATLSEALVEMGKAKEAISILADVPEDLRPIRDVPDLLYRVAGALRIVNQAEAADVLAGIVRQLKQGYLAGGHVPVPVELERLAEAVSAVELYLEGLATGGPRRPELLREARQALDQLAEMIPSAEPPSEVTSGQASAEPVGAGGDQGAEGPSPDMAPAIDPELLEIFLEEAEGEQKTVREQYARWRQDPGDAAALTVLRRSFHTLKGSGRWVGALRVGEFAAAVEALLNRVIDHSVQVSPALLGYMDEAVGVVPELIAAETEATAFEVGGLIRRATALAAGSAQGGHEPAPAVAPKPGKTAAAEIIPWPLPAPKPKVAAEPAPEDSEVEILAHTDGELLDIFRTEARQHVAALHEYVAACGNEPVVGPPHESVVRSLHTLAGSARMTGIRSIAEATAPVEQVFRGLMESGRAVDAVSLDLLSRALDALDSRLDRLPQAGAEISSLRDIGAAARSLVSRAAQPSTSQPSTSQPEEAGQPAAEAETPEAETPEEEAVEAEAPEAEAPEAEAAEAEAPEAPYASPPPQAEPEPEPLDAAAFETLPADREMVAIFLEDARELLDKLDAQFRALQLAPTDSAPLDALQRLLHTLKGSARLSGLGAVGDLSHAFESLLTTITNGRARVDDDTLELAQRTLDALSDQMDAVEQGVPVRRATQLIDALGQVREGGLPESAATQPAVAVMAPAPTAVAAEPSGVSDRPSEPAGGKAERAAAPESAGPLIRVRADLLNRLVNDAGEISIYRSRLAQQNGLLGFRLGELDQTVGRLREKLRHLEIETEAQILHRFQRDTAQEGADHAEFDPLELDRFSTLQQLSRSLAETVNDLISLRTLLSDLQRDSDALLQQQARIADDLQDGLLRTRMVPFAQVVPRLHRLVRQTASQTGREARLEVFGPEVELDRSIQERAVAPLEHLLRNAVAHGIELPAERVQAGKPATGVVSLMLSREGNDVVITVADDGAGLNVEAIRRRALERGLLSGAADVSDEEVAELILTPGFSTAEKVTQIAGRGVGLDVVSSEIKQMSGSFAMDTRRGRGTSFTIRLPLTLAIIESLLVAMGEEIFAVPHATVEGVSRIEHSELEACYRGKGKDISYGGHDFRVLYLGSMLQLPGVPDLGERRWLPVVLVRAGGQRLAFHVDQLIGSERIVVKPLGPQLSSIRWLSGGTILADGRVALIVDLIALIRSGAVHEYQPPRLAGGPQEHRQACVMVVDDSLTVRRVTNELTRHVRRSPRFNRIPIIMITSRTGDKHRNYALDLGVDRYLGKPYQEAELMDEISSVLAEGSR